MRFCDVAAQASDAEHPAAGGHHAAVGFGGAGVEDLGVGEVVFGLQAVNDVAGLVVEGIAAARQHHAEGGAGIPLHLRLVVIAQAFPQRLQAERGQIRLEAHQHRLRLWIAEAAVELDDARLAVAVDHQADVEEALKGRAFGGHAAQRGADDALHDAAVNLRRHHAGWRIGAHAAGVGPQVAVVAGLVILGRRQRQGANAIAEADEGRLFAEQAVLDDHLAAGAPETPAAEHVPRRAHRLFDVAPRHHHALASREAVRLDHDGRPAAANVALGRSGIHEGFAGRGGNVVARHERLGERLGAFEAGGRLGRAEAGQPAGIEDVADARHEQRLRADQREVHAFGGGEVSKGVRVRVDCHVADLAALGGGARIAWGHEHALHLGGARGRPGERVFAPAAADHQHLHEGASR